MGTGTDDIPWKISADVFSLGAVKIGGAAWHVLSSRSPRPPVRFSALRPALPSHPSLPQEIEKLGEANFSTRRKSDNWFTDRVSRRRAMGWFG